MRDCRLSGRLTVNLYDKLKQKMPHSTTLHDTADLRNFRQSAVLKNGNAVQVRAVRPDDKGRILEAFRNLKEESIYSRFFYHKRELTPEDLKWATEMNFETEVALAVTIGNGDREVIIGVGRFSVVEGAGPPRTAEVAFTVEEDYHNLGMAGILLRHLADIAVRLDIGRFEADVLTHNSGMLKVFRKSGLPMKTAPRGEVVHVTLQLDSKAR